MSEPTQWQNRIVGEGEQQASQFMANPKNFRRHPQNQRDAMRGALNEVGWVQRVIVNKRTGYLVDGHERVWQALQNDDATVPYVEVDLDEAEEAYVLATLDPIGAMANADAAQLAELMREVQSGEAGVQQMLAELAEETGAIEFGDGLGLDDWAESNADADQIYSDDQIIDAAFTYFRATGFPYRNLPIHVCMQEINKLANTDVDKLMRTNTAYHVADTYHPRRFHASAEGMKSPFDAFQDDKLLRRAIELQIEQVGTIGETMWAYIQLVHGTQPCANFRPGFACHLYRRYAPANATVLDTSTGYGGRLVGFMASGVAGKYIGIDPNVPTHEGNMRMAQELGFADRVELYNLPAEDVPIETVADRCDFAFTSPPYFAKEHYSDDDTQSWVRYQTADAWRDGFLVPMLALQYAALKPGCTAIVNIADVKLRGKTYPLEAWCKESAQAVGFEYVDTERFEMTRRFGAGQDDEVATEPVIILRKPSAAS